MHGVLTSDLLMKSIYCYVAKDGYAARVQDTKSYDAIRSVNSLSFISVLEANRYNSAKISYQDGHSLSSQTITIQAATPMNTNAETSIYQRTVQSFYPG